MLLGTRTKALDFEISAARESRRIVAEAVAGWQLDLDIHAIESCTSELVTDALRNGRSPLQLVVQNWGDGVQVMVISGGHRAKGPGGPGYDESEVRQRIVEGLATSWGVEPLPAGTAAWFDMQADPPAGLLAYRR